MQFADHVKNTRPQEDGESAAADTHLAKFFTNPEFGHFSEPATILDRHDCIMLWHLPHIFSPARVVGSFSSYTLVIYWN